MPLQLLDLSIIIVSFNTRKILLDCIESVFRHTEGITFEVHVVDNASTDGSPDAIKERFPQVSLIRNSTNLGFSAANNQAIRLAKGRYVVLLNSDTLLIDNAFQKIIRYLDKHPEYSIITPQVLDRDNRVCSMRLWEDTPMDAFWRILGKYDVAGEYKKMGAIKPKEVETIGGSCFIIRVSLFDAIGLLDEQYFLYNEEDDFCRRARRQGHKICYYPDASIKHLHGQSTHQPEIREKVIIETYKSNLFFYSKYYSQAWNLALRALYKFTFFLGIIHSTWTYLTGSSKPTADDSIVLKCKLLFMSVPKRN